MTGPKRLATAMFAVLLLTGVFIAEVRSDAGPRVVEISAKRYAFTPDEIHLKKGEPVVLRLTSQDRTHGFLMKKLGIDADIVPGRPTELTITPQIAGTFTTICDHYCGPGHGDMHMTIVVE